MKSKQDNIAEYILYLWQMEDYLRAFPEHANANEDLCELNEMMHREGIMEQGHLQIAQTALQQMEELHLHLLDTDAAYRAAAISMLPSLAQLKSKTDRPAMSDVEACLVLLYQIMLLHLQHRAISSETEHVQRQATRMLQHISRLYKHQAESQGL